VLLLGLILSQLPIDRVRGEEDPSDPYDTLYDVIMTRYGTDGKSYGENESSPALFDRSDFPFGDKTYKKFSAALDAFAALPQAKMEAYSDIKRALLQRHLWKVFDATLPGRQQRLAAIFPNSSHFLAVRSHSDRRAATRPKIASLIQRLALTRAQILALPNTFAATVESDGFAERHDPDDLFKPFLPVDLYSKESSWICLGDGQPGGARPQAPSKLGDPIPADLHSAKFKWRSAFLPFMRVPGRRLETLKCVEKFNRKEELPVGTQFALIEQAFLVSDEGELVLSPLIVSVSLRAYVGVNPSKQTGRPRATQSVTEFLMQPRRLMQGDAVMKALDPQDYRYEAGTAGDLIGGTFDFFESRERTVPRLNNCINCHGQPRTIGFRTARPLFLKEGSPEAISKATSARKRDDKTWKALHELWRADSRKKGTQSPAPADKPQPPLDNKESTTCGAKDAADPYDTLYDVIMTRYGPDGKSYGENESSPAIWRSSEFPFGDKTYKKFNAALGAFAALPQAKIEAYSDVKRALLQRHLWKVFDTTTPIRWIDVRTKEPRVYRRPHADRRDAVRPKIASLIQRVALTKAQIRALPNTMAATVKSGGFAQSHEPNDLFKPFLPVDLYSTKSSWVCLGELDSPIPANQHASKFKWRSAFHSFMNVPGGRAETLKCVKKFNRREELPVGTQFALIEQAFLISDDGELILSPLTVSISFRAYIGVNQIARTGRYRATQCVAEFVMQPRQLMQGNAVMKALDPGDYRFEVDDTGGTGGLTGEDDPFETATLWLRGRLTRCTSCHGQSRPYKPQTVVGVRTARSGFLKEGSPEAISKATSARKRDDDTWKTLHELWVADSTNEGKQSSARIEQTQSPLGNTGKPVDRGPAAAVVPGSTFDELYDVLMVRHARNGEAYGENEIAPMIFKFSGFPFDDATYPRLTKSLDKLTPTEIKTYSVVQRAILQRQMWAVIDSTTPSRFVTRRPHEERRNAVREQLAGLIRLLALKRSEIESLLDTLLKTVDAKKYPTEFDLEEPTSPFLSSELMEDSSAWICFGRASSPVTFHADRDRWRSSRSSKEYSNHRLIRLRARDKTSPVTDASHKLITEGVECGVKANVVRDS
jgi:hypothetical protein